MKTLLFLIFSVVSLVAQIKPTYYDNPTKRAGPTNLTYVMEGLTVRTQVNVGTTGEAGLIQIRNTNAANVLSIFVTDTGLLTLSNNTTLVLAIDPSSGYSGGGTLYLSDDGTYRPAAGGPGVTNYFDSIFVTNLFAGNTYISNLFVTNLTLFSNVTFRGRTEFITTNTFLTNFYFNNTYITNINQGTGGGASLNPTPGFYPYNSNGVVFADGSWYWRATNGVANPNYTLLGTTNTIFGSYQYPLGIQGAAGKSTFVINANQSGSDSAISWYLVRTNGAQQPSFYVTGFSDGSSLPGNAKLGYFENLANVVLNDITIDSPVANAFGNISLYGLSSPNNLTNQETMGVFGRSDGTGGARSWNVGVGALVATPDAGSTNAGLHARVTGTSGIQAGALIEVMGSDTARVNLSGSAVLVLDGRSTGGDLILARSGNGATNEFRVKAASGYTGAGTLFLSDDGTYKSAGAGPGGDIIWTNSGGYTQLVGTNLFAIRDSDGSEFGGPGSPDFGYTLINTNTFYFQHVSTNDYSSYDSGIAQARFDFGILPDPGSVVGSVVVFDGSARTGNTNITGRLGAEALGPSYNTAAYIGGVIGKDDRTYSFLQLKTSNGNPPFAIYNENGTNGIIIDTVDLFTGATIPVTSGNLLTVNNSGTNALTFSFASQLTVLGASSYLSASGGAGLYGSLGPADLEVFNGNNGFVADVTGSLWFSDPSLRYTADGGSTWIMQLAPNIADGSTPYIWDTGTNHTSGNLAELKNNGTNRFVIAHNGNPTVNNNEAEAFVSVTSSSGTSKFGTSTAGHANVIAGVGGDIYFGVNNNGTGDFVMLSTALIPTSTETRDVGSVVNKFRNVITTGVSSYAADTTVTIASTGWTNTFGKNAVVYLDGVGLTFTVYNNAGASVYTNSVSLVGASVLLQPSGKVLITAGTLGVGRATPF